MTGLLLVHVIGTTEGSVERTELRATVIRACDGSSVSMPNAEALTSRVSDDTAAPARRAGVGIGMPIAYDTDIPAATKAMLAAACATQGVL